MTRIGSIVAVLGCVLPSGYGAAADIRCKGIVDTYQPLLDGTSKGINAVMERFKALDKGAPDSQRETLRKKYCAVGGEGVGLYRALSMQIDGCVAAGENLDALPGEVGGYREQTKKAVNYVCG